MSLFRGGPRRLISLLTELSRRRVGAVAAGYAVVGWVAIEFVTDVAPNLPFLDLPEWLPTVTIGLVILGFPIALGVAWVYDLTPRGVERTGPEAGTTRRATPLQMVGAVGYLGLAVVFVALGTRALWERHGPVEVEAGVLAVFPPCDEDRNRSEDLALLTARALDGLGGLRVVDPNQAIRGAAWEGTDCRDVPEGRRLARRMGAGRFVLGGLVDAGEGLQADLTVYDASGERAYTVSQGVASRADLVQLAEVLAAGVADQELGGSLGGPVKLTELSQSHGARRAYLDGERSYRAADWDSAAVYWQRAVELDSTFVLGWLRLARALHEPGDDPRGFREAVDQAVRRAEDLSDRDRYRLDMMVLMKEGRVPRAIELARTHVGRHPYDAEAWDNLGQLEWHWGKMLGSPRRGVDALERSVELEPDRSTEIYEKLIAVYRWIGEDERADSLDAIYVPAPQSDLHALVFRAWRAFASDDTAAQRASLEELERSGDFAVRFIGALPEEAIRRVVINPLRPAPVRAMGHVMIGDSRLSRGAVRSALAAYDSAGGIGPAKGLLYTAHALTLPFVEVSPSEVEELRRELRAWAPPPPAEPFHPWYDPETLFLPQARAYFLGVTSAALGDTVSALAWADSLDAMPSPEAIGALSANYARGVRARVAMTAGDEERALRHLESMEVRIAFPYINSSPLPTHPSERFLRAELLDRLGRSDEALDWYMSHKGADGTREGVLSAPAHFRRAEIHERRGETAEAVDQYRRFLAAWTDPDPEYRPWIEKAEAALERSAGG